MFRALDQQPLTVSELATRLGVTKQAAGQIVTDMEERSLVSRRPGRKPSRPWCRPSSTSAGPRVAGSPGSAPTTSDRQVPTIGSSSWRLKSESLRENISRRSSKDRASTSGATSMPYPLISAESCVGTTEVTTESP